MPALRHLTEDYRVSPPIKTTTDHLSSNFSTIIDVRSPSEYANDHVPGAINMPVLHDIERAEVGTIYKQVGSFEAKRRGAALISRNISHILETKLANSPRNFSPLIYCWRGGQRSGAMARILSEIGWKVTLLEEATRPTESVLWMDLINYQGHYAL